ncbi:MAG: anthranilate synthase component I [Halanaerobiaceae bacterium]
MIDFEEFIQLNGEYNMIPLYDEIIVDTKTPVSLYRQLSDLDDYSFLLESASSGERVNVGRYSFIGLSPKKVFKNTKNGVQVTDGQGQILEEDNSRSLNQYLNHYLENIRALQLEDLPPFSGGLVGYFGYEMVAEWEELFHQEKNRQLQKSDLPSTILVLARLVVVYDHLTKTVKIIDNVFLEEDLDYREKKELYLASKKKIKEIISLIRNPQKSNSEITDTAELQSGSLKSNTQKEEFKEMVSKAKQYIKEGEVFQLVLSQKFSIETNQDPFQVYRALRVANPSPYMFYLNFPEIKLIGSSPEILVRVQENKVITRPLAGTRKRGKNRAEDMELEKDLLNDEKEKAEHIMLVDLGRNDLGMVCKYNSIRVTELMGVEYYSRVMHLVSQVEGEKRDDLTSLDVLKSVFPAGTVSGAPKIRAMELIDDLEKEPRGVYAGAVGYIDFRGNLDTCITIRTFSYQDGILSAQVGAGMVADSVPEKEHQETLNKAQALFEALEITRKEAPYGLSYR